MVRLSRSGPVVGQDRVWNPDAGTIEISKLDGFDSVIHLAGENIAAGRWTASRKQRIRESREKGTRLLAEALAKVPHPPRVLVSASAIGYYGDRGSEVLTEGSAPGHDFLAEVCKAWEAAAEPAGRRGIRVVHPRIGVVLGRKGGALAKMALPFRMGAGGRIGDGRQYMSWITLTDLCRSIIYALQTETLAGPYNAVSPNPVTNAEFTKALGAALHRPAIFPLPAFAARIALGEMADALLLSSARVQPARLTAAGFRFDDEDITPALSKLVGA